MSKIAKKLISVLTFLLLGIHIIFAHQNTQLTKGKIVIMVLDVSGSIKKEFQDITKIIDRSIVKERLDVGDYFVLIPFGDNALPMYSGQLLRIEDKSSISNTLKAMKADNDYTDIGSAIKTALNYIIDLKNDDYNLYEPLVLFITDGDITTTNTSEFYQQNVDQIFEDPIIGNKYLYDGWYYVGIGKNLHDLPLIAEKSGREDYLLCIEDLDQLEFMLDDWISKIPVSQPLETGEVLFDNFKLKGYKLKPNKNSKVLSTTNELSFCIFNTYKTTLVNLEFKSAFATFQTKDKKQTIPIKLSPEVGLIQIHGMQSKQTDCRFAPNGELKGKGTLKVKFIASVNGIEKQFDEAFEIDGKTTSELLFDKLFLPLLVLAFVVIIVLLYVIIKKFMPVKIVMEIVGKPSLKFKTVLAKINKKIEFGSKPGLQFKLDNSQFSSVVGQLQRIGSNKWQIIPRDRGAFENGSSTFSYTLNTTIKLKTKEDESVSIKFKLKK